MYVEDYSPILQEAINEAKAAGLGMEISKLQSAAYSACTTSSELLGEQGVAIRHFLNSHGDTAPISVRKKLEYCLSEIHKVWPKI
jgi:hypothetical protein